AHHRLGRRQVYIDLAIVDAERLIAGPDDRRRVLRLDQSARRQLRRVLLILLIKVALSPFVTETNLTASPRARNLAAVPPTLSSLSSGCAPMQRICRCAISETLLF